MINFVLIFKILAVDQMPHRKRLFVAMKRLALAEDCCWKRLSFDILWHRPLVTRLFYCMLQSAMWTQQTQTQQTHSKNEQLMMSSEEEGRWSNIESKDLDGGIDRCCSCRGGGGHLLPSLEDSSIPCRAPPSHGQLRHRSQSSPVCKVPRSRKKCFNRRITLLAYSACLFN